MSVLNVGVDLGVTSKHHAEVRDEKGQKVRPNFSFSDTKGDFDALCEHALREVPEGGLNYDSFVSLHLCPGFL